MLSGDPQAADPALRDPAPLVLAGSLCSRRAEFEALGFATECRQGSVPESPPAARAIFLSADDWRSARWHAPGARAIVVGASESSAARQIALGSAPDRESVVAALARASAPATSSADWRSWARIGLESARAIHDINNALSRALALAEVHAIDAPPDGTIQLVIQELINAGGAPQRLWAKISEARHESGGGRAADALWNAAEELSWPTSERPRVLVAEEPRELLKASAPELRIFADVLLEFAMANCGVGGATLRLRGGSPGPKLDFADRRAACVPGRRWLEVTLEVRSGQELPRAGGESLEQLVVSLQGAGRWRLGSLRDRAPSALDIWLPLRVDPAIHLEVRHANRRS